MKRYTEIYIGNILESYYRSYAGLSDTERIFWTKYDALDNNRSLLYGGDDKVIVTPMKISDQQLDYICGLAGWKNVLNLFPEEMSSSICEDVFSDKKLNAVIIDVIKTNPGIKIIPYRQTEEFYGLAEKLKQMGLQFTLPETPNPENRFIERYFHSKRGFRHLWEMVKDPSLDIKIPDGFITADKTEAIEAAFWFKSVNKDFTIKYNRGVQGLGLIFVDHTDMPPEKTEFVKKLSGMLTDGIWNEPAIIIEEKIDIDPEKFGGSPDVEMRIDENGKVHREYPCEQVIASDHKTFLGVSMNKEVTLSPYMETAFKAGEKYAQKLSELGYRGFFDMDLVISKTGKLYAVEANLRRTGGTHAHMFAQTLLGNTYMYKYYLMIKDFKNKKIAGYKPEDLFNKLEKILYDQKTKRGVVIVNADMAQVGVLPVLYIGTKREYLVDLDKQLEETLCG